MSTMLCQLDSLVTLCYNYITMNSNIIKRKQFVVHLPIDLIKEIKKQAIDEDRRLYHVIEDAIVMYLNKKEEKE